MNKAKPDSDEKSMGYEIFIGLLAIISISDMVIMALPGVSSYTKQVLEIIQAFLTIFFVIDFLYRLRTAKSKSHYFFRNWGWADLLSCLPQLRILRLFRLAKVYRLLKNYGYKRIISEIADNRAEMAIYLIVVLVVLVLQIGGVWVLKFESQSPDANIKTGGDSLW